MSCKGIAKKGKRKIQAHPTAAASVHALIWQFARRLWGMRNQKQVLPILHFARLAVILDKSRGVSDMRNQKQVPPILHFARLAVIFDKSRGVSDMRNQKRVIDFAFRSTCSNFG